MPRWQIGNAKQILGFEIGDDDRGALAQDFLRLGGYVAVGGEQVFDQQSLAFATQLAKSLQTSAIRHTLGWPAFPGSLTLRESRGAPAESKHAGNRHDEADQQHRADENRQILVSAVINVEQEIEILGL